MDTREVVDDWLKQIGATVGADFSLEEDGTCGFDFGPDGICVLEVPEGSGIAHLTASLGEPPQDPELGPAALMNALELNSYLDATRGAAIAFDSNLGQFMLCYNYDIASGTADSLSIVLSNFRVAMKEVIKALELPDVEEDDKAVSDPARRAKRVPSSQQPGLDAFGNPIR